MSNSANANEWGGDVLGRKKYSVFLTKYLLEKKESCVININAPWGHGKTFFIKKWYGDIKEQHPAVYFNAWENDFSNDPLLSIIACIKKEIIPLLPAETISADTRKNFLNTSGKLLKKSAPIIFKALVNKALGEGGFEALSGLSTEDESTVADVSGTFAEELLSEHEDISNSITEFQSCVTTMIEAITKDEKLNTPLFIFIDELDRCRPLYSIELLERIKHVFNIPEVIFVVATDTEQLSHSVKAVYGEGFNGVTYLRRFFDQIYTLPEPNYIEFSTLLFKGFKSNVNYYQYGIYSNIIDIQIKNSQIYNSHPDQYRNMLFCKDNENAESILLFSLFAKLFKLDLRTKKQCFDRFVAIEKNITKNEELHFGYLIFLIMFDASNPSEFKKYSAFDQNKDIKMNIIKNLVSYRSDTIILGDTGEVLSAVSLINIYTELLSYTKSHLNERIIAQGNNENDFCLKNTIKISGYTNYEYLIKYIEKVEMAEALG